MSSVSCSICWDVVTSTCVASYLQCGHVYHHHCLDKWLKASRTCPECRNTATHTRRIYLNLVPDPEVEMLNVELTRKAKEYEFLTTDNDTQDAIIKQLERQMSAKDEELLLSTKRNDELKSSNSSLLHRNEKLKLEAGMQEKKQMCLDIEVTDLKHQLDAAQSKNLEITNSTVALKEYYREQVKQISDLHSEILNLTERLDQFRGLYVAANNRLQVQVQENQVIANERDSLLTRNTQLYQKMYSLKMRVHKSLVRKIKKKYIDRPQSSVKAFQLTGRKRREPGFLEDDTVTINEHQPQKAGVELCENLKIKLVKLTHGEKVYSQVENKKWKMREHQVKTSESLKIKLVKSKLNWECVKS